MKNIFKKHNGEISIIGTLLGIIIILLGVLLIRILFSNNKGKINNTKISNSNEINQSIEDNKKEYSKQDVVSLLEKGEKYNNFSCEYKIDDSTGNIALKFKDNVLVAENSSQIIYQNYPKNKHIVIDKRKRVALVSTIGKGSLIPLNKNYCNGLVNIVNNPGFTYKYLREEKLNLVDCIVVEIKGTIYSNSQFYFGERKDFSSAIANMSIWISKKSGLVAKIDAKYEVNANDTFSKVVDYNLVIDKVTDNDIKEPNLSGYRVTNL